MIKPIYNRKGWVLGQCQECGNLDYVEPHGTTAFCSKQKKDTEHANIPYQYRDMSGTRLLRKPPFNNPAKVNKWIKATAVRIRKVGNKTLVDIKGKR